MDNYLSLYSTEIQSIANIITATAILAGIITYLGNRRKGRLNNQPYFYFPRSIFFFELNGNGTITILDKNKDAINSLYIDTINKGLQPADFVCEPVLLSFCGNKFSKCYQRIEKELTVQNKNLKFKLNDGPYNNMLTMHVNHQPNVTFVRVDEDIRLLLPPMLNDYFTYHFLKRFNNRIIYSEDELSISDRWEHGHILSLKLKYKDINGHTYKRILKANGFITIDENYFKVQLDYRF